MKKWAIEDLLNIKFTKDQCKYYETLWVLVHGGPAMGKSTMLAAFFCELAMANPNVEIHVYDHCPAFQCTRFMLDRVCGLLEQASIPEKMFKIDTRNMTVTFITKEKKK